MSQAQVAEHATPMHQVALIPVEGRPGPPPNDTIRCANFYGRQTPVPVALARTKFLITHRNCLNCVPPNHCGMRWRV